MLYLGQPKFMGGHRESWETGMKKVPCDSIQLEAGLSKLAAEIQDMFPEWLDMFTDALES